MDCTWVWVWKLKFKYQTQSTAALPDQTIKTALTEEFMFQNVAYRPTVYITGMPGNRALNFLGNFWKFLGNKFTTVW